MDRPRRRTETGAAAVEFALVAPLLLVLLFGPLLKALGIDVAGADYAAVPRTDCGAPALRG